MTINGIQAEQAQTAPQFSVPACDAMEVIQNGTRSYDMYIFRGSQAFSLEYSKFDLVYSPHRGIVSDERMGIVRPNVVIMEIDRASGAQLVVFRDQSELWLGKISNTVFCIPYQFTGEITNGKLELTLHDYLEYEMDIPKGAIVNTINGKRISSDDTHVLYDGLYYYVVGSRSEALTIGYSSEAVHEKLTLSTDWMQVRYSDSAQVYLDTLIERDYYYRMADLSALEPGLYAIPASYQHFCLVEVR